MQPASSSGVANSSATDAPAFDCTRDTWGIRGRIIHGHGRGGTMLGFPTANIEVSAPLAVATEARLKEGINHVFFGWGVVEHSAEKTPCGEGNVFPMVMSVGYNPHFKDVHTLAIEAHYLHKFGADFYGSFVRIAVLGELRAMSAFTTLEALIETIKGDCREATERLAALGEWKKCAFLAGVGPSAAEEASPLLVTPLTMGTATGAVAPQTPSSL